MRVLSLALLAASALAVYDPAAPTGPEIIPNEYIVVLHPHVRMSHHLGQMGAMVNETNTMHMYEIGDFQGYAVKMEAGEAKSLAAHKDVKYVEPNMVARALQNDCTRVPFQAPWSWGLGRTVIAGPIPPSPPIAQQPYELRQGASGQGVVVHVIDTGIMCTHEDFENRCTMGFDATGEGLFDGNGHGTHVASTSVGVRFGLARRATTVGVKVLGSNGSGSFAGVIAGINFSANAARSNPSTKIVGNMSLGGGRQQAVNDATDASVQAGLVMVVAAGNSNNNACNSSPASAPRAYTVMSSDSTDARSTFSSFGTCCNIFAPGTGITAAWIGGNTRTNTISGTSMAAPHVAGIAAKWWSSNPSMTNSEVERAISGAANQNLIRNPGAGSPNLLALMNCQSA
jgi:subtilisin family serine protease